jgi:histidyl-tRNA synthetase
VIDRIQAIRGMNDVLPSQSVAWRNLEQVFARCLSEYSYQEIRMPILESTQLFKRTIGEITDIVEKEMYTFNDLNGDSLTLRPEGTAGCVRACLEHGLLHNQQQKLWYCGPMFRHEKPQKGRYRQFTQLGVEVFGITGAGIDLELIAICRRFWNALGIAHAVNLQVNTLGTLAERQVYRDVLVNYFKPNFDGLDEDSKRRLDKNPLRILDSKNPKMESLIAGAPKLIDVISEESRQHFIMLCDGLKALGIPYTINPFLVRGLDYYGHTVFEWVTDKLGSQATVCAGGRFDALVEQLGGNPTPAIGFAMGAERLLLLMEALSITPVTDSPPHVFIIAVGDEALQRALVIAESLRSDETPLKVLVNTAGGSIKNQFKKADKSGASLAFILGVDEMLEQTISIKNLRHFAEQVTIPQHELNQYLKKASV